MEFVNRHSEIQTLRTEYNRLGSSFVVLYGRRRLGKTTLLQEFLKDYPNNTFYFADKESEQQQINKFKDLVAMNHGDTYMNDVTFNHWDKNIEYYLQRTDFSTKSILIIDEFQYLAMVNPAFPSMLQRYWDMQLKDKNIMLIICGSSVSILYSAALSYNSPLYGRRTAQIQLKNIHFKYIKAFFPSITDNRKLVEFYAITSGIPKYMELLDKDKSALENIKIHYLKKDSFLYNDAKFLLMDEVKETINYFSVMKVIAGGAHKLSDICNRLQVQSSQITPYLETLREIDLVERRIPITESNPEKSKKGLYFIKDQYMRFWYRYIFPFQSFLELNNDTWVMNKVTTEFNHYISLIFEDICKNLLMEWYGPVYNHVGSHWDSNTEIDVVARNENGTQILYGECKWTEQPVDIGVYYDLVEKTKKIEGWTNARKPDIQFALFSKNGFSPDFSKIKAKNLRLFDFSTMPLFE